MGKLFLVAAVLFAGAPRGTAAGPESAEKDLLFYAPFDTGLGPEIAEGDKAPAVEGECEFAEGRIGKGLVVGKPKNFVTYSAAKNLDPSCGTIAMWVKSINWKIPDKQFHVFFQCPPHLILYSYKDGNPMYFYASRDGTTDPIAVASFFTKWYEEEWHHLAATWKGRTMAIYFDGAPKGSVEAAFDLKAGPRFSVGPQHAWAYDGDPGEEPLSVIDEFRIYCRPLSDKEIESLSGK